MQFVADNLFALPETQKLLADEWSVVRQRAARVAAGPALSLSPLRRVDEALLPTHSRMVCLDLDDAGWTGDVRCALSSLPIESESIQLIVVRHIFEFLDPACGVEAELARVLAPGGLLLVFGLNPLSPWRLWCSRHARSGMRRPRARSASQVRRLLASENLDLAVDEFVGGAWPSKPGTLHVDSGAGHGARWHGAWLLSARKQRVAGRLVRLPGNRQRSVIQPGFVQAPSRRAGQ